MTVDSTALALCVTFPILALLSVTARFYARWLKKTPYAADDWTIVPALLLAIGNAINVLYGAVHANLGQHIPLDSAGFAILGPKLTALEKVKSSVPWISTQMLTMGVVFAIFLARLSILLLYARIFTNYGFRMCIYVMYGLNGLWGLAFTFVYVLQCVPIKEYWELQEGKQDHCVNVSVNYYNAVSTIILDVLTLAMPWPIVWRLNMAVKQKLLVLAMFTLGAVVVAISIGKCYAFFTVGARIAKDGDVTYDESPLLYWTVPECCLAVVCACLPSLRPIFQEWSGKSILGTMRRVLSLSSLLPHTRPKSAATSMTKYISNTNMPPTSLDSESSKNLVELQEPSNKQAIPDSVAVIENRCQRTDEEPIELSDLEQGREGIRMHRAFEQTESRV